MPDYSKNLIIGLGGVGGRSIASFRKTAALRPNDMQELTASGAKFEYLYIDSHNDILSNKKRWEVYGRSIALNKNDILDIRGDNTKLQIVEHTANISPWLGDINRHLGEKIGKTHDGLPNVSTIVGANQLRRYGRALFALNASDVRTPLRDKINQLSEGTSECNFHVFATLGGGTGSGSIIDMVTMIRQMCEGLRRKCNTYLYIFVAGEAALDSNAGSFYENEYAALRDLNALMTGKFHPYMTGADVLEDENIFNLPNPIKTVYVSSELAASHMNLDEQVDYMAAGCFDIIHASVVGNLAEGVQKAFSGEDLIVTNPGEPDSQDLQRSYRFSTFGMRRWCVPTDETREALKNKLECMVYDRWITGSPTEFGSSTESVRTRRDAGLDVDQFIDRGSLCNAFISLADSYKQQLAAVCDQQDPDADLLSQVTSMAKNYAQEIIDYKHDENKQREYKKVFSLDVEDIYSKLLEVLGEKRSWVVGRDVWGLKDIDFYVKDLASKLNNDADSSEDVFDFSDCGNMLKREAEWRKIAFLTKFLGFKPKAMLKYHREEACAWIDKAVIHLQSNVVKKLKKSLALKLKTLIGTISVAIDHIKKAQDKASASAKSILDVLESDRTHKSFVYEIDILNLREFIKAYEDDNHEKVAHVMQSLESEWVKNVGSFDKYNSEKTGPNLIKAINLSSDHGLSNLWSQTEFLHDEVIKACPTISSVLVANLYERLEQMAQGDYARIEANIQKFLNNFNTSVAITPSLGLTRPQAAPMRALAIGLPESGGHGELRDTLEKRIKNSVGTKISENRVSVYKHNCGNEIRLLYSEYWMPARFMDVVDVVEGHYMRALAKANTAENRATLYFANIDDEGAKPSPADRPQLTARALFEEDIVKDLEIAKLLSVIDDQEKVHALIQEEEFKLFVWTGFQYGFPQYEEFSSSIANAPTASFRSLLKKGLDASAQSMSDAQKQEVLNKLRQSVREKNFSPTSPKFKAAIAQISRLEQVLAIKA